MSRTTRIVAVVAFDPYLHSNCIGFVIPGKIAFILEVAKILWSCQYDSLAGRLQHILLERKCWIHRRRVQFCWKSGESSVVISARSLNGRLHHSPFRYHQLVELLHDQHPSSSCLMSDADPTPCQRNLSSRKFYNLLAERLDAPSMNGGSWSASPFSP